MAQSQCIAASATTMSRLRAPEIGCDIKRLRSCRSKRSDVDGIVDLNRSATSREYSSTYDLTRAVIP